MFASCQFNAPPQLGELQLLYLQIMCRVLMQMFAYILGLLTSEWAHSLRLSEAKWYQGCWLLRSGQSINLMSCETDGQTHRAKHRRRGVCFKINLHAGTENKLEKAHSKYFLPSAQRKQLINSSGCIKKSIKMRFRHNWVTIHSYSGLYR